VFRKKAYSQKYNFSNNSYDDIILTVLGVTRRGNNMK